MTPRTTAALAAALAVCGCAGGDTAVTGVVSYNGRPVEGAMLTLVAEGGGPPASTSTGPGGRFRVAPPGNTGPAPGSYKVLVSKVSIAAGPDSLKPQVPVRYASEAKTPLRVTLPAAGEVRLELTD